MRLFITIITAALLLLATSCGHSAEGYLAKGNKLFADGKFADAAINYKNALQRKPGWGEAYYRLGLTALRQKDASAAYAALSQAVELTPNNDDAKAKLCDLVLPQYARDPVHFQALHKQVSDLSEQLLKKNPNSFDGLRIQGNLAILDNRLPLAIEELEKANRLRPMQPEIVFNLGLVLTKSNRLADAEKMAREVLAKDPNFEAGNRILYAVLMSTGRTQEAETFLISRVNANPKDSRGIILLAQHYVAVKQRPKVIATLQRLTNDTRDFPDGHLQAGDFYRGTGDIESARHEYEEGLRASGANKAVYQKRIAGILMGLGRKDEALNMTEAILKDDPKDEDALRSKAALLVGRHEKGDVDTAVSTLQSLVAKRPDNAILEFQLGEAYQAKGDANAARAELQKSARTGQGYAPPRLALAQMDLQQGKFDESKRYLDEVIEREPKNRQARLLHAGVLVRTQQISEARSELNAILTDAPHDAEAQLQLAALSIIEKEYRSAEVGFKKLYRPGQQDPRPVIGLADTYISKGEPSTAIELLKTELKSRDNPLVRLTLADTAVRMKDYPLALQQYQALAASHPADPAVQLRLAYTYEVTGHMDEAISSTEKADKAAPHNPQIVATLARMMMSAGRNDVARDKFRELLSFDAGNANVMNNLAFLIADSGGNMEEALKLARQATEKQPDDPHFTDTLGYVYLKKHQTADAERTFNTLVSQDPKNPTYRFHLASALFDKGDKPHAKEELQKALAQKPSQSEEQKIRQLLAAIG